MNEVVVITGANRGLGYSLAKIFLQKGYHVAVLNRRESDAIRHLKNEYESNLSIYLGDVRDQNTVKNIAKTIEVELEQVDYLINNAAVHTSNSDHQESGIPNVEDLNFDNINIDLEVNSVAPLKVIKHFIRLIRKGTAKKIVNISSEAGSIGNAWRTNVYGYCMSKAALNMASKILQNYLKDEKIKVLAIHPGWFTSDMGGDNAPISPDQAADNVVNTILQDWDVQDPIFVDAADGSKMEW